MTALNPAESAALIRRAVDHARKMTKATTEGRWVRTPDDRIARDTRPGHTPQYVMRGPVADWYDVEHITTWDPWTVFSVLTVLENVADIAHLLPADNFLVRSAVDAARQILRLPDPDTEETEK